MRGAQSRACFSSFLCVSSDAAAPSLCAAQAGWRLGQAYGRQFEKLLEFVRSDVVPRLVASGDANPALLLRLSTYLDTRRHATQPEGRALPERDESSLQRT